MTMRRLRQMAHTNLRGLLGGLYGREAVAVAGALSKSRKLLPGKK
jgi:hypothetical protein